VLVPTADAWEKDNSLEETNYLADPEPKRVSIGMVTRKGKLSPAAEKFCECARETFGTIR
jgi:hypothetical protein